MEYRILGGSSLKLPVLTFGTGSFSDRSQFDRDWGGLTASESTRIVEIGMDAALNCFDSADVYGAGLCEEVLGAAIQGRRDKVIISTKGTFRTGKGPHDVGSSRAHLIPAIEGSLRRLRTDYIDLYQLHGFDAMTPIEETLEVLDEMVRAGKIRYIGCSNFSGWHLMKSLAISEKKGFARYVAHQAYYSLIAREYEWELMELAHDQKIGTVVWSPLGWGRLTGKIRRDEKFPAGSRLNNQVIFKSGPQVPEDYLFRVLDALQSVSHETGKSVPQIALNWLLTRPTVSTLIIGARNEAQLKDNLATLEWKLSPEHCQRLNEASKTPLVYPYWHQRNFRERNPPLCD